MSAFSMDLAGCRVRRPSSGSSLAIAVTLALFVHTGLLITTVQGQAVTSVTTKTQDGCYGGYLALDCGTPGLLIRIVNETYGRNPKDKCSPSDSGGDCSVDPGPMSFYRNLCNGNASCQHLGVPWQYINRTGCVDIYTNYVHITYQCYSNATARLIHSQLASTNRNDVRQYFSVTVGVWPVDDIDAGGNVKHGPSHHWCSDNLKHGPSQYQVIGPMTGFYQKNVTVLCHRNDV